jgi:hypothetical protein
MKKEQDAPSSLTREEHIARAMLMGMRYHDGNGHDPFYYIVDASGNIDVSNFVDAITLEPLIQHSDEHFDFEGLSRNYQARRKIK